MLAISAHFHEVRNLLRIYSSYAISRQYAPRCRIKKMTIPRKYIPVLAFLTVIIIVRTSRTISRNLVHRDSKTTHSILEGPPRLEIQSRLQENIQVPLRALADTEYHNWTLRPLGEPYTKMIVIPQTKDEDVEWVYTNFGGNTHIHSSIYSVDDVSAELHPPKNKGHEVMIYLSYIIDSYDDLADVNIFMHSHRYAWHNDDLMDQDAVQMISRLSAERVRREGYMNMRCHWEPGCPSWMHPGTIEEDINKQEESMLGTVWPELFPLDPIPSVLAQPCCAQFAISRDRIRSLPLARYAFYRDRLLRTALSDYISGRVWEYIWQFVFTGNNVLCPREHVCYCDGFGICFGGEEEYAAYWRMDGEKDTLEEELRSWREDSERIRSLREEGKSAEAGEIEEPEIGRDLELETRIKVLQAWCDKEKQRAKESGDVAMNRAVEAGREWRDGDGF